MILQNQLELVALYPLLQSISCCGLFGSLPSGCLVVVNLMTNDQSFDLIILARNEVLNYIKIHIYIQYQSVDVSTTVM